MRAVICIFYFNLRELAPLLTPEDPSREAYWVANGNRRRAGSRQLGHLGGDKKNQVLYREFAFLAVSKTPLGGTAPAAGMRI